MTTHKRRKILFIILTLQLLLCSCGLHENCGDYTQTDLDEAYEEGYEEGYDEAYYDFYEEYEDLDNYTWMLDNIVFTTRTGECYHKASCHYVQNTQVWVNFVNGAEDSGYRPCSYCFGGY